VKEIALIQFSPQQPWFVDMGISVVACIEAASLALLRHDVFYSSTDDDSRSFDSL
jgi:hypothetical protein